MTEKTVENQETKAADPFEGFVTTSSAEPDVEPTAQAVDKEPDKEAAKNGSETPETGAEEAKDGSKAEQDESAKEPAKKNSVEERIAKITKARREAEREAAARAEEAAAKDRRIAELEAQLAGGKKDTKDPLTAGGGGGNGEDAPPDPTKFDFGEVDPRYIAALTRYEARSLLAAERKKDEETRHAAAAAEKAREASAKMEAHIVEGVKKYDDFESVVLEGALKDIPPVAEETAELLRSSEHCADILYHFGKNPEEAAEMAKKSPIEQARYLGKLEAKFSSVKDAPPKKEVKVTKAGAPPERARGADGKFGVSPDTDDFAAFDKAYGNTR